MLIKANDPYVDCPVLESENFSFRLVQDDDAQDLLACYADEKAVPLFNSDNCTSDFYYRTAEEMQRCIGFWVREYEQRYYIRFAIVDKRSKQAIGTVEYFAKDEAFEDFGVVGVLRLDLASPYEKEGYITEILQMVEEKFHQTFGTQSVITKAIPEARERVRALSTAGYEPLPEGTIVQFGDYHVRRSEGRLKS